MDYGEAEDMHFAAYTYIRGARLLENEKAPTHAEQSYLRALELKAKIYQMNDTPQNKQAMFECAQYLSAFYKKQGGIIFRFKKAGMINQLVRKCRI